MDGGIKNLLVFYYPRDWRVGEVIWTPAPATVISVKEKHRSASAVTAVELPKLQTQMLAEDICMIFLLIDAPEDQLMAYQHTKRSNFITHKGVDKLFGAIGLLRHYQNGRSIVLTSLRFPLSVLRTFAQTGTSYPINLSLQLL